MQGVVGLFRGITPTLLGILPYSGIAFAFNEQGKRKVCIMLRGVAWLFWHPTYELIFLASCSLIMNRIVDSKLDLSRFNHY
jgi:hypothetical protein